MADEKKKVAYTDPNGIQQTGWAIDGHIYTDEAGTNPMPVGSTYTAPDGRMYTQTANGGQYAGILNQTDNWSTADNPWYIQSQRIWSQINNREPFSFDLDKNALYQQYRQQYQKLGQQAMRDTQAQATGLTGGYGSSYAQNVGQQAYNGYLSKLGNVAPELYAQARSEYDRDYQNLLNQWQLMQSLYSQDRNWYNTDRSWNYQKQQNERNWAYQQQQSARQNQYNSYNSLVSLISNTGYQPTDAELAAAGMTRAEANAWRARYQRGY